MSVLAGLPLYWKAAVGFVAPGAVVIGSAVADGSGISTSEWVTAIVASVVTAAAVARTPNKAKPEDGQVNLVTVAAACVIVLAVALLFLLTPLNWGRG